jgi:hypothetical protein
MNVEKIKFEEIVLDIGSGLRVGETVIAPLAGELPVGLRG